MSFTYDDAKAMVGDSTDYCVGLQASIPKWEQITREESVGEDLQYSKCSMCGICFVNINRHSSCDECPAYYLCCEINDDTDPLWVLEKLHELESELKED